MKCDRCDVGSARVQPVSYRTYTIYPPVCPFLVVQAKYHYPLLSPPRDVVLCCLGVYLDVQSLLPPKPDVFFSFLFPRTVVLGV